MVTLTLTKSAPEKELTLRQLPVGHVALDSDGAVVLRTSGGIVALSLPYNDFYQFDDVLNLDETYVVEDFGKLTVDLVEPAGDGE